MLLHVCPGLQQYKARPGTPCRPWREGWRRACLAADITAITKWPKRLYTRTADDGHAALLGDVRRVP